MMNAVPRAMPITPSVAMNGGRPTRTISSDESRPVDGADEQAGGGAGAERPAGFDEQVAGHDARERDDGARREIDAAGDDDDRRADRGDAVDRRVLEDQQRVLGVEERMRAAAVRPEIPGEEQHLEQQDRDRAQLARRRQRRLHDARRRLVTSPGCITASSVASAPGDLALHPALAHDDDAIGQREHFGQIARHDEAREPAAPPAGGSSS